MFLFLRLLFAHFLGDFPFQTKQIFLWKAKGGVGKWGHTIVIFLISVLFVYPYWGYLDMWLYLIAAGLMHHLSDWIKVELNKRGSPRQHLLRYLGDQLVHIFTAAAVLCLGISNLRLESGGPAWWAGFYNSDYWMAYGCMLIVATYFGTYFIECFKRSYAPQSVTDRLPPEYYKYHGIVERACVFNLAFFGGWLWALIPLAVLPRWALARRCPDLKEYKIAPTSVLEISLTVLLAVVPALGLLWLAPRL